MTRRSILPPAFTGPFLVSTALAAGVPRSRLRASDLVSPTRGVRVPAPKTPTDAAQRMAADPRELEQIDARAALIARAREVSPALLPGQFFSHETALAAIGCPLPSYPHTLSLHVSAYRPSGMPRRAAVVGHRLQARAPATIRSRGLPAEHPARAWRQTATLWSLDDLVAAGDFLVCPRNRLLTLDELRAEVAEMGDVAGGVLSEALELLRLGVESPGETRLRLALHRAGLPEPQINWSLYAPGGMLVARLDLSYLRYRVAVEYDGRVHAEDAAQFERDADRWDAIRAEGWQHVRILNHHLRPDPRVAVRKVVDALVAAGWRPGDR